MKLTFPLMELAFPLLELTFPSMELAFPLLELGFPSMEMAFFIKENIADEKNVQPLLLKRSRRAS